MSSFLYADKNSDIESPSPSTGAVESYFTLGAWGDLVPSRDEAKSKHVLLAVLKDDLARSSIVR